MKKKKTKLEHQQQKVALDIMIFIFSILALKPHSGLCVILVSKPRKNFSMAAVGTLGAIQKRNV